jgi:ornithine decarboxylase
LGPTCDSLDRLPDGLPLPQDCQTGDYVLFAGLGAYSSAMSTQFNGYGLSDVATVIELSGQLSHES